MHKVLRFPLQAAGPCLRLRHAGPAQRQLVKLRFQAWKIKNTGFLRGEAPLHPLLTSDCSWRRFASRSPVDRMLAVNIGGKLFGIVPAQSLVTDFANYQSYDNYGNEYTGESANTRSHSSRKNLQAP